MTKMVMHIVEAPGGVERYLKTLLSSMRKYGDIEHVLVCSSQYDVYSFKDLVKCVEVVDELRNKISFCLDIKAMRRIRKLIKQFRPDIVYCNSSKAGAIGRLANFRIKNKLIYNAHGWAFNMKNIDKIKKLFYRQIERVLAPMADTIVCISEYERICALKQRICKDNKITVINNGIDFDELTNNNPKSRDSLNIPNDAFVIGMIGRITPQKAPDTFIKMAAEIKRSIENAFFLIVGDDIGNGQTRHEIECMITEKNLDNSILITGWVDNPMDYLGVFDVACLLSRWEGFGLVLAEYMYMEKPIVATRVDAIPVVVGDAGLLVDVDDYSNAAKYVIKLFEDSLLRKTIISKGKERVKLFDVRRTAEQSIELFNRI